MKRNTDYDFSQCLFNPTIPNFVTSIQTIPEFAKYDGDLPKKKVFAWIVVMYDLNSPLRRTITNYYDRKKMSAELAGWAIGRNGEFDEPTTKMLLGGDDKVNVLIVAYLSMFSMPEYTQLVAYLNMQYGLTRDAMTDKFDHNTAKILDYVTVKIKDLTNEVFGSGQVSEMMQARRALYNMAERERIRLNPENIVKIMVEEGELPDDFSPYGKGYKPEKIKFVGDE